MKVFVTVGTTPFDSLIREIDRGRNANESVLQVANGLYEPVNCEWFRFKSDVEQDVLSADIVVSHAGAGSVFGFLQRGIVPIIVPNTERRDQHQLEIARWLERKRYAVVAHKIQFVNDIIDNYNALRSNCTQFKETRFFYQDKLNSLIKEKLSE